MLFGGRLHSEWMRKKMGKGILLLSLPVTCQNFACFFVSPVTTPAGLPSTLNREEMNMPGPFSAFKCALVRVNTAMFVLQGEQVRHEVSFVQLKINPYHSEDSEGLVAYSGNVNMKPTWKGQSFPKQPSGCLKPLGQRPS